MKNKIIIALTVLVSVFSSSCKKYLDINTNPNVPQEVGPELLLPSAQAAIGHALGNNFQINGSFWAQHWTQSPLANQYKIYEQYQPGTDNYNRPWRLIYSSGLMDLNKMYDIAKASKKKQYMAIARLLQVYTYQLATDAWGDVPFSEALLANPTSASITSPKYDSQKDIYTGILNMLAETDSLIDSGDPVVPGADDLIYGGDMDKWAMFANTLKLKIGMRLSEVDPTWAQSVVASVDPAMVIATNDDEAKINYSATGGNENPLYSEMVGLSRTKNIYGSATCVDLLNNNNDLRLFEFYTPNSSGNVIGIVQGDYNNATTATGKAIGGTKVGANPDSANSALAPVRFISASEAQFLLAEAIARGWLSGDDQAAFEEGISQSFQAYGLAVKDANDYIADTNAIVSKYPASGTTAEKIEAIITQKWIAMCGNQGFEAWTEWRRTGFPNIFTYSLNGLTGGKFPQRFLYPTDEVSLNSKFPGNKEVYDKVWWDAN